MTRFLPGCLLAALVFASSPLHALDFKDGRWRVVIESETRGMEVKLPPKYQYEHCLTQKDFKPDITPLTPACRSMDLVTDGDEVSWKFACRESSNNVHGHGRLKFAGTRFEGTINTYSEFPKQFEVIQKLSGRYLGVCRQQERQAGRPSAPLKSYDELRNYDEVK